MRDRDRVLYSTAFRRLAGKTQIYTIGLDDHRKNRLTHSLEVSQISRTIACSLGLDNDLTEAIALGHDLGHTPFGHIGEEMLHNIIIPKSDFVKESPFYQRDIHQISEDLKNLHHYYVDVSNFDRMFGFKHNIQSVRVACIIEDSYRDNEKNNIGLNLTNYTLWGMMNHSRIKYNPEDPYPNYQKQFDRFIVVKDTDTEAWSLEAYIVRLSDDIAQWHHDLEDAIRGDAIPLKVICETIEEALSKRLSSFEHNLIKEIKDNQNEDRRCIADLSHIVVNTLVKDVYETSARNMEIVGECLKKKFENRSDEEISKKFYSNYEKLELPLPKDQIISLSELVDREKFEKVIKKQVHHSFDVERMNSKGKYIIRKLFEAYFSNPQQLPDGYVFHYMVDIGEYDNIDEAKSKGAGYIRTQFNERIKDFDFVEKSILMRRICDHIACMTDNYAIEEYHKLYG